MILTNFAFYLFATICVASAFMVIAARNPVHSVLFLILAFFNSAGLFVLLGAEFLALILVIVYVGAVAVLFLFVVMMLDIDFIKLREGFLQYLPIGGLVGSILLIELILVLSGSSFIVDMVMPPVPLETMPTDSSAIATTLSNTEALGMVLYTKYIFYFQVAGAILLVAMIGAIMLTLQKQDNPRQQDINAQNARRRQDSVELVERDSGQGL